MGENCTLFDFDRLDDGFRSRCHSRVLAAFNNVTENFSITGTIQIWENMTSQQSYTQVIAVQKRL